VKSAHSQAAVARCLQGEFPFHGQCSIVGKKGIQTFLICTAEQ
jgi:hypothetical protein